MGAVKADVITFPVRTKLVCFDCGSPGEGTCRCGAPYVTPGVRAEAAVKATPNDSDRTIADRIGVSQPTVQRARKKAGDTHVSPEKRTGKDGKSYTVTRKAVDKKGRVAGVDIKVDPALWQAFNEKALRERKSATAMIAALITHEIDPNPTPRVELSKTAQEKLDSAIRQHQRKLDAEHAARLKTVDEEVRRRVTAEGKDYLARMKVLEDKAWNDEKHWREMVANHKPPFTSEQFKVILMCLHPDGQRTEEKLSSAFRLFNGKKLQLTGEK